MEIRKIREQDVDEVSALIMRNFDEVMKDSNEIVATGAVANFGDEVNPKYSISNFFVKPELHKNGIGRIMFNNLLKIATDKGAKTFHVPSSRNAVSFYGKMGFVKDELQQDEADEITWMSMHI